MYKISVSGFIWYVINNKIAFILINLVLIYIINNNIFIIDIYYWMKIVVI